MYMPGGGGYNFHYKGIYRCAAGMVYCKRGLFRWGDFRVFSAFCLLRENYPHAKIKPITFMKEIGVES